MQLLAISVCKECENDINNGVSQDECGRQTDEEKIRS